MSKLNLNKISTEQINENTKNIDLMNTVEMLSTINKEDEIITKAIGSQIKNISKVVDLGYEVIKNDGRIIYVGSGTSGRLGILDASEMLPTYNLEIGKIVGLIAGGENAITNPVENAEDDKEQSIKDLKKINFNSKDLVIGIAASGRTPYSIAALEYANSIGAKTASLSMSADSEISKLTENWIEVVTGPEVVTGSTRMKAGTATKQVLNMISTGVMIKSGKVYGNLMIDVRATNEKLKMRIFGIVKNITKANDDKINEVIKATNYDAKLSSLMILKNIDGDAAKKILEQNNGILRKALNDKGI